ncbi:hypothetical protein QFC20_002858 [Naganishia adeliensis]|uniref:Uncharacterized protein n=1 Tax=Naganishia adeliensis TaxID=92952 RepID=A0ACC2WFJ6_9TREE|nr:hypothetical protein QFC20_002858 [Naganishia adeliensis]
MDPPMALLGDPHRYRQCLLNLLSNAIKFTKPSINGKRPTVSVTWTWRESLNKVEITCAVRDEGIGIHAKSMHKLFQSFSQVDSGISRTFGGTGLGLSITRGLARTLGGDCWAESLEGQGSTFYLLVTTEKAKQSKLPDYLKGPSSTTRRAIILAELSPATAVLQANLECFGIQTSLGSIEDAVIEPPTDLVIVDVGNLTVTSTVLADLKAHYVSSKFVFLVSLTDQGNLSGDIKDEIIVTKPIKALSLYNATRAADVTGGVIQQRRKVAGKMDVRYAELYRLKICYIDDSSVNVAVGKKILSKFGYKDIDVCSDGLQAVEAARKTKYDLMLMDLQPTKDRCMLDEQFQGFLTKPLLISSYVSVSSGNDYQLLTRKLRLSLAETLKAAHERKCALEISHSPLTKHNGE